MTNPPLAIDSIFDALGDATRRKIVARLRIGPAAASTLAAPLGVTLTAVVQHIRVLENCGLVRSQKQGRTRTCELDLRGFEAMQSWVDFHRSTWETRLDALGDVLNTN
jgi:DNA-binding transcriptional ArsR family regulator